MPVFTGDPFGDVIEPLQVDSCRSVTSRRSVTAGRIA